MTGDARANRTVAAASLAALAVIAALAALAVPVALDVPLAGAAPAADVDATDPPVAEFDHTPAQPEVGSTVRFDARDSSDPDGSVVEYRWDFDGDGTVDRTATDPTAEYAYGAAGTYDVALTVVDDAGETDTAVLPVGVEEAERPPAAACSASPTEVALGEDVTIDATGSERAEAVRFDVDGDGSPDTPPREGFRATVSYEEPGEYSPRVVALGAGTAEADCGTVVVRGGTTRGASAAGSPGEGGSGLPVDPVVLAVVAFVGSLVAAVIRIRRLGSD